MTKNGVPQKQIVVRKKWVRQPRLSAQSARTRNRLRCVATSRLCNEAERYRQRLKRPLKAHSRATEIIYGRTRFPSQRCCNQGVETQIRRTKNDSIDFCWLIQKSSSELHIKSDAMRVYVLTKRKLTGIINTIIITTTTIIITYYYY